MARQLRLHYAGGWYHITSRGMGRQAIFRDDRDREHFVELLSMMVGRYGVALHAYVLMENHCHLLIETPAANASRALQWLNLSRSMWFKARHNHAGTAFVEGLRKRVPKRARGETNARAWRRILPSGEIVRAVESVKGLAWTGFADRRADWGRDMALHFGRMRCGLTLKELGEQAGGLGVPAVAKAVERMAVRLKTDRALQRSAARVLMMLKKRKV